MGPDFFSEDTEQMQQLPTYAPQPMRWADLPEVRQSLAAQRTAQLRAVAKSGSEGSGPAPAAGEYRNASEVCAPRCGWECASKECNQVCEPSCAPPECKIMCGRDVSLCETRCGPPQCAVICPPTDCPSGGAGCGKCRTVCSPPVCTTNCGDNCQSVCEKPRCSWACHEGACPKPACKLNCTGFEPCKRTFQYANSSVPDPYPGEEVEAVTEGVASLDVAVLAAPATPPPHWEQVGPPAGLAVVPAGAHAGASALQTNLAHAFTVRWKEDGGHSGAVD